MTATTDPSRWRTATVAAVRQEGRNAKTYTFRLPEVAGHKAGQHYELRLTAASGYQAARLYSAASPADGGTMLELTIARVAEGEVSPYLFDRLQAGDQIEIRGPLGKFFIWEPSIVRPVLLVAGGAGVIPMRCMLRAHRAVATTTPMKLIYSVRTEADMLYRQELLPDDRVLVTLTTSSPPSGWLGRSGRITRALIDELLQSYNEMPLVYICGMTAFVEAVSTLLVGSGVPPQNIKAERYGG